MSPKPPTSDQLRNAIDSGRTGDKVAFPDPAAAPLGTDDEASGFPPTPQQREMAAQRPLGPPSASHNMQWALLPLIVVLPTILILAVLWLALSAR